MATVSSHILDSVSGNSAIGIRCQLIQHSGDSAGQVVFDVNADAEGRIVETVKVNSSNHGCEFELIFHGAEYFGDRVPDNDTMVKAVVIRFIIDDDQKRYHLPVMLAPHSYSTWWSS